MLKDTVLHHWSLQYPASVNYRRAFLKYSITELEASGTEICGELYEGYTDLLNQSTEEQTDRCFKTYLLPEREPIHLRESTSLISQGTTGLHTWQAAQHLAEWCLEHSEHFKSKKILELGSGLGLTGLVICRHCHPERFTFSDCHPDVLTLLAENIQQNIACDTSQHNCGSHTATPDKTGKTSTDSKTSLDSVEVCCRSQHVGLDSGCYPISLGTNWCMDSTMVASSRDSERPSTVTSYRHKQKDGIVLLGFDWEVVSDEELIALAQEVDVVVAADVVYDTSIIPSLVRVLHIQLSHSRVREPVAYIASTVRNERTRDSFLQALEAAGISYKTLPGPLHQLLHYDRSAPIEILELSLPR